MTTLSLLASAWAAIEGYDLMRKYPEESMVNGMGNLLFLCGTVLFVVDICVLFGGG